MKRILYLLIFCFSQLTFNSCKKGCIDPIALNLDEEAENDDGTCEYSRAIFYQSRNSFSTGTIEKVEVYLFQDLIGETSIHYPSAPNNCSAFGTVLYLFEDGDMIDWNVKIFLTEGEVLYRSGITIANANNVCVRINVTPL